MVVVGEADIFAFVAVVVASAVGLGDWNNGHFRIQIDPRGIHAVLAHALLDAAFCVRILPAAAHVGAAQSTGSRDVGTREIVAGLANLAVAVEVPVVAIEFQMSVVDVVCAAVAATAQMFGGTARFVVVVALPGDGPGVVRCVLFEPSKSPAALSPCSLVAPSLPPTISQTFRSTLAPNPIHPWPLAYFPFLAPAEPAIVGLPEHGAPFRPPTCAASEHSHSSSIRVVPESEASFRYGFRSTTFANCYCSPTSCTHRDTFCV